MPDAAAEWAVDGEPLPILMLPGTLCDERVFVPLVRRLKGWPVIPGAMDGADSTAGLARHVLDRAPARFILAGFSLGGIVALEIAARAPERVAGLLLMNTTPRPIPPGDWPARRQAGVDAHARGVDGYILGAWERLVSPANLEDEALQALLVAMARSGGAQLLARQIEVAVGRADSRPRLARIAVPTLVLAGEHEQVCPLEAQREIADAVPGARLHLIPAAGHFAPLENPDAMAHHILDWLRGEGAAPEKSSTASEEDR